MRGTEEWIADTCAELLFHIATAADWAQSGDPYLPADFKREGFVHCSTGQQVIGTANRLFRGRPDLLLLMIDVSRVHAPIRYENLYGGAELFPHIYAGLPRDAVIAMEPLAAREDGSFDTSSLKRCVEQARRRRRVGQNAPPA